MKNKQTHPICGKSVLRRKAREQRVLYDILDSTDDQQKVVQAACADRRRIRLNIVVAVATMLAFLLVAFGQDTVSAQKQSKAKKAAEKDKDDDDDELTEGLKPFETGIDYKPTNPNKRITFNLENADLPELVRLISQITGRRFIISSKARSIKATVYAPTKVTVAEAYQAFLSILELNGMALVRSGKYYKIVDSGGIENRPIDLLTDDGNIPRGDRFVTRLHHLDYIPSDDAAGVLGRFKSGDGSVTSYEPTNTLIITDTGTNINRMMRILKVIDIPHSSENIWIEPVFHADASEIAKRLTEVFEASAKKGASSSKTAPARKGKKDEPVSIGSKSGDSHITQILADERTNSLIIMATETAYRRILDMLRHLDIAMEGEGNIRVHYLQHSDAEEIAGTLSKLVTQKTSSAKKGAKDTVAVFEGEIAITAHKSSNALVITSSARDYASLRQTIDELDIKRRQVFIEAVIMELNVKRNSSLGMGYHGGVEDFPVDDSLMVMGFQPQSGPTTAFGVVNPDMLTGLAVGIQGPTIDVPGVGDLSIPSFGVALKAVSGSSDANILSTPNLIATDNVEAEISIGSNEPLQTSAVASYGNLPNMTSLLGGQAAGAGNLLSALGGGFGGTVPRQDVGTTIKITPHINDSDEIRLEISEEISSVGAADNSGNVGVKSVNRTRANTEVSVSDQQTVVIGGLMRDSVSTGQEKIPILGDIPLIGVLFRSSSKDKVKKNLILFLTPYIIRSPEDLRSIYERKMRERQEFIDRYMVASGKEYEAPVDYSRTRGLVSEMLKELKLLDERRKLLREAEALPPQEHLPSEAIGEVVESEDSGSEATDGQESGNAETSDPSTEPSQEAPQNLPPQFNPGTPIPGGIPPMPSPEPEEPE